MKTIGFIGLGLIGGSIAKAIRKYHEDYRILAYDQNRETLATAVSSNMIDAVCEEHDERFKGCDYIFQVFYEILTSFFMNSLYFHEHFIYFQ